MARSITTRRPLWVQEVDFDDGTVGYATDGTPVDCVRLAQPRAGRGVRGRAGRVRASTTARTSATTSPTRARWRRRSRRSCSACPGSRSRSSRARCELDFRVGSGFDFAVAASFTARLVAELESVPLPAGTLLNINVPGRRPRRASRWRGSASASTATSCRWSTRRRAAGGCTGSTATPATSATRPGPIWPRSRRARSRSRPIHFDLTDRDGLSALAALRPGAADRAGRASEVSVDERARPRHAATRARAAELRKQLELPRLPLLRARRPRDRRRRVRRAVQRAARRSRPSIPSWSRRTRRPSGSAREPVSRPREGPPPAADAVARQRALGRGAPGVDPADAQPPRARGDRRIRSSSSWPSRRSTAWRSR